MTDLVQLTVYKDIAIITLNNPPVNALSPGVPEGISEALERSAQDEYSDRQAPEDGVLVSVSGEGKVNRVTRAVFDHFTKPMESSPATGPVTDVARLQGAIRVMLKIEPDKDAWPTDTYATCQPVQGAPFEPQYQ